MLRLATGGIYKIPFEVGGTTTVFHLKSLSIAERHTFLQSLGKSEEDGGVEGLAEKLSEMIVAIEGYEESPSAVLKCIEHADDLRSIVRQVAKWCRLDEQSEKNWSSSLEPSTLDSVRESVETSARVDDEPVSTIPTNGAASPQEVKD